MQPDIRISKLLAERRPFRSFEFFPPKDETGLATLTQTASTLVALAPAFVSVTYGAGGSTRQRTAQTCAELRRVAGCPVMPHLTCVGHSRDELVEIIGQIHAAGFRNIMALRGDPPKGENAFVPYRDGFRHASDLVSLIKSLHPDICVGVAGYPERHPEAASAEDDLANLKRKMDAGADFITTQLFFENAAFYRFAERCRGTGIWAPILPGIMPVLSLKQIQRFTALCGATLPPALITQLEQAVDSPERAEEVGIAWALEQVRDLITQGVGGYHLYLLNRSRSAFALAAGLTS